MSEAHYVQCDDCCHSVTVFCDGRNPPRKPSGWLRVGNNDYCEDCRKDHE